MPLASTSLTLANTLTSTTSNAPLATPLANASQPRASHESRIVVSFASRAEQPTRPRPLSGPPLDSYLGPRYTVRVGARYRVGGVWITRRRR